MNPADIRNKRFDKSIGGYKPESVHQFLEIVSDHVSTLETENIELQEKMEFLAEKVSQYREDEESLRAALIGAQKLGQSVVRESQRKAEAILSAAVQKAEELVNEAQINMDNEAIALQKMQKDFMGFRENIISLYSKELEQVKKPPESSFAPAISRAQIKYAPPKLESIQIDELTNINEDVEDDTVEFKFPSTVGAKANINSADKKEDSNEAKRNKFGELSEFFGEDKPIKRQ